MERFVPQGELLATRRNKAKREMKKTILTAITVSAFFVIAIGIQSTKAQSVPYVTCNSTFINVGDTTEFTVHISGGEYIYRWYCNDVLASGANYSPTWYFAPTSAGTYMIKVSITDGFLFLTTIPAKVVTVLTTPAPSPSPASAPTSTPLRTNFFSSNPSATPNLSPSSSIAPLPSIPEFPSFIVFPFLMAAVLAGAIINKKKLSQQ